MAAGQEYLLGHSERELERLQLQAHCLEGLTGRLIRECGVKPGMRVLDIGSGAGDVAMLLAEAVGANGRVVGVDAEERALQMARRRAEVAGFTQIEFVVGTDQTLKDHAPFDAAVGRLVLHHQPDPTAMVRRVASAVRSGGIVAFMEPATHVGAQTHPQTELLRAVRESVMRCVHALPSHDIAGRLIPCFIDAGLPEPRVLWESFVPGSDPTFLRWFIATYETFLPLMKRLGTIDPAVGDPATLFDRILEEGLAHRVQFVSPPYVSAWATRP
jgi:ubiquinone/menaquinone biosynthesis C-methylase UbiE